MIFNRIGDAGFLIAMFLIFERTGSLQYQTVFSRLGHVGGPSLVAIALLLFLGAAGKSAQLPLYPWLADAMEGPTPVSALIHAATMVTAGVYLMCRINPILYRAPDAAHVVAIVGALTAFLGATIACAQTDIKKILAYSTISQLGYMFIAAGVGAYVAAIFLMLTHAFYKALLFLGAGSVIHAMNDEQNTKAMGGLRKIMPITAVTFLVAWLSIGGFPLLSGFWSKGDVLLNAYGFSPALYALGALTAVLTAYYIGRCYMLVFSGNARWVEARPSGDGRGASTESAGHGHESSHGHGPLAPHDPSWVMTVPLVVLAFLSVFGGIINLPFHPNFLQLEHWLNPVIGNRLFNHHFTPTTEILFALVDAVLALVGIAVAVTVWRNAVDRPEVEPTFLQPCLVHRLRLRPPRRPYVDADGIGHVDGCRQQDHRRRRERCRPALPVDRRHREEGANGLRPQLRARHHGGPRPAARLCVHEDGLMNPWFPYLTVLVLLPAGAGAGRRRSPRPRIGWRSGRSAGWGRSPPSAWRSPRRCSSTPERAPIRWWPCTPGSRRSGSRGPSASTASRSSSS